MSAPAPRPRVRSLDLSTYVRARDFFEAVHDAARERERILGAIGSMEEREGVRAQGYDARGRSSSVIDRTRVTDARIDYETENVRLLEEDEAMISLAESLIWGGRGGDMTGGVAELMGVSVARAMELRYVHALPLSVVAERMRYSPKSKGVVAELCRAGLEYIDSHRLMSVARGEGDAT